MTPLIRTLRSELRSLLANPSTPYTVPGLWVGSDTPVTFPSAPAYLLHQFQVIDQDERRRRHRPWSVSHALAYNCMVRHVTSYNHGEGTAESGWRTTGTFIKLAALLPYLVRMDVDTLVLMPITEIGTVGRKGTLGSAYAVKHPWHIDPLLAEPSIPISVEDQARILVEACHALGIRVVLETVLRTASIDSSLAQTHPEWFYWVDEGKVAELEGGFVAPRFSPESLKVMKQMVASGNHHNLPEPPDTYRDLFTPPPLRVEADERGWKGIGPKQRTLRVPGAFADWPTDDPQPAWTDVTYLRLHDHPQYRYMAYNTVRMFESALEVDEYRSQPLWNTIASIIPYYIRMLNIDGAMIDMGHALPADLRMRIMREARALRQDFLLLEENFSDSDDQSRHSGYDAAVGSLPLVATSVSAIRDFIQNKAGSTSTVKYFGTPESHNTPRAQYHWKHGKAVAAVWTVLRVLPNALGFVHAGIELDEVVPVNTGLGFSDELARAYPPEKLPLFSDVPLPWDTQSVVLTAIVRVARLLHGTSFWEHSTEHDLLIPLTMPEAGVAFLRIPSNSRQGLLCVANLSDQPLRSRLTIPADSGVMFLAPNAKVKRAGSTIDVELDPWDVELVFTLH